MNIALRRPPAAPMTLQQFLAWEERQELRYEFDGIRPVAMTGGTAAHSAIQSNLIIALGGRLRGRPCRVHGSELKIAVAGRIRYPDAFVVCTPMSPRATVANEPVVIFEVLSPSTAATDFFVKTAEYLATPSVQRYVLLEQSAIAAMALSRKGSEWICQPMAGDAAVLNLPELGLELPLSEIYDGIELEAAAESDSSEG